MVFRNELDAHGHTRYCYVFGDGLESPNLRLSPGDLLILTLKNELTSLAAPSAGANAPSAAVANKSAIAPAGIGAPPTDPCGNMRMTITSTNLHFHGLTVPPLFAIRMMCSRP